MIYLGVNTKTNRCCVIETDGIVSHMHATNWNGSDEVERTLRLMNYKVTGLKTAYNGEYHGSDYDMGHTYDFIFHFNELWEVIKEA